MDQESKGATAPPPWLQISPACVSAPPRGTHELGTINSLRTLPNVKINPKMTNPESQQKLRVELILEFETLSIMVLNLVH